MKKQNKKIELRREIVRSLSGLDLAKAAGGRTHTLGIDNTCFPSDEATCPSHFLTECC